LKEDFLMKRAANFEPWQELDLMLLKPAKLR
jgi:hypothetical protein